MNSATQTFTFNGGGGSIEALIDPASSQVPYRGVALLAHPHPLFGGTMHNKVVQTMARAYVQAGYKAVRFNFRGVENSQGVHANGEGEAQDFAQMLQQIAPQGPFSIAGFSFGAYVAVKSFTHFFSSRSPDQIILVGAAAGRFDIPTIPAQEHEKVLLVHGELDTTVALADVMNWARPQNLPVCVIPGGEHFFHGRLPQLKQLIFKHLIAT